MPYISFKTKSDIFLTPIPFPKFFMLDQISSVFHIFKKSTPAFLYPSTDIRYILYIPKNKEKIFFGNENFKLKSS